jgi:hypothetical protein
LTSVTFPQPMMPQRTWSIHVLSVRELKSESRIKEQEWPTDDCQKTEDACSV